MPKPILKPSQIQNYSGNMLSAVKKQELKQETQKMDKMKLDRLLRKARSKEYINALHKLDAGGHVHNQNKVKEIMDSIRNEFPEVEISGILLGLVSKCYLGKPYEVHTLDTANQIIEHYKSGQPLPSGLEKARSIALRGGYDFIEVYTDCCRAIGTDGTVSVITN